MPVVGQGTPGCAYREHCISANRHASIHWLKDDEWRLHFTLPQGSRVKDGLNLGILEGPIIKAGFIH